MLSSIDVDIPPVTPAGARMVALAEGHAAVVAEQAARHDRENTFDRDAFEDMATSGFLAACLPESLGGLGITRTADLAAAFNRLARGSGAVALAAHMHTVTALGLARLWSSMRREGGSVPSWMDDLVHDIGEGSALLCVAGSEPGQTLGWFETVGAPTEGGYLVSGRKAFASASPLATHLYLMFRIPSGSDGWTSAVAIIDRGLPGVEVLDDWDAMGMRASGSNGVLLERCLVPADRVLPVGQARKVSRYWIRFFVEGNVGLLASFVGVAEAARALAVSHVEHRSSAVTGASLASRPAIQHALAEVDVRIGVARASVERIARITDAFYAAERSAPAPMPEHHRLMAEFQATKLAVNTAAIEAVDRALTMLGGGGYANGSPMSRLYRDVRAGPFMQAYSPNEAYEYIGRVGLDLLPDLLE